MPRLQGRLPNTTEETSEGAAASNQPGRWRIGHGMFKSIAPYLLARDQEPGSQSHHHWFSQLQPGGILKAEMLCPMSPTSPDLVCPPKSAKSNKNVASPCFCFRISALWHLMGRTKLTMRTLAARESEKCCFFSFQTLEFRNAPQKEVRMDAEDQQIMPS